MDEDEEIECDVIESYGKFSQGFRNWNKEVNLISWNGRPAKLDIRNWQRDHEKCGKGIAVTWEEAGELAKLLDRILKEKSAKSKSQEKQSQSSKKTRTAKKPVLPNTLEPFYDELELLFGANPAECKSARNSLLKKYHPDRNALNTGFATRKTIKIKEAYEKIMEWWGKNS